MDNFQYVGASADLKGGPFNSHILQFALCDNDSGASGNCYVSGSVVRL